MSQELIVVFICPALQKSSSEGQSSPHNLQQGGSVSNDELDKLRSDYSDKKQQVIRMLEYFFNFEVAHFYLILVEILAINLKKFFPFTLLCRKSDKQTGILCPVIHLNIRLLLRQTDLLDL